MAKKMQNEPKEVNGRNEIRKEQRRKGIEKVNELHCTEAERRKEKELNERGNYNTEMTPIVLYTYSRTYSLDVHSVLCFSDPLRIFYSILSCFLI